MEYSLDGIILDSVPTADPVARDNAEKVMELLSLLPSEQVSLEFLAGQLCIEVADPRGPILVNASCRSSGKEIYDEICLGRDL